MRMGSRRMHFVTCEGCGDESGDCFSQIAAERVARDRGWAEENGVTRCADCRNMVPKARYADVLDEFQNGRMKILDLAEKEGKR